MIVYNTCMVVYNTCMVVYNTCMLVYNTCMAGVVELPDLCTWLVGHLNYDISIVYKYGSFPIEELSITVTPSFLSLPVDTRIYQKVIRKKTINDSERRVTICHKTVCRFTGGFHLCPRQSREIMDSSYWKDCCAIFWRVSHFQNIAAMWLRVEMKFKTTDKHEKVEFLMI